GARGDAGPGRLLRVEVEVIGQQGNGPARRAAEYLRDRVPLRPAALSKFEFGLSRSTRGTRGEPSPGRAGENLTADSPADTVARAVVGHQLEALVANEPAARAGFSAEPLHDLRVAARRMRAALSLFKRQLPAELLAYRDEARWIGRATGPLRDLDVHLAAATDDSSGPAAPEDVVGLLRERQARARRAMIRALASPRFARFVSGCHELLEEAAPAPAGERPVAEVAVPLLDRRYASMRRRGRRLGPGSPAEDFHELRIAAKKLRYALEFLAPIFGRELKRYRSRLVSLQDLLGEHQDADVSAAALRDLARAHAGRLSPDGRRFVLASAEAGERKAKHLRRRFPDVWDRLSPSPWKGVLAACER
ncbi:MAG: CHAD domain-containing protein, partial [Dehalococcoidia bacterium]